MLAVRETVERVAPFDVPVLVTGETGTGKELIARNLHQLGPRRGRPFVAVNCGAVADTLLEAELFGHVRGAFTGADRTRAGLFEEADRGTLFLDEVAELSPRGQTILLRALQEREYRRVGESHVRHSDFRLVAATHKTLDEECARGRFRRDLFYRVAVARVEVPPLRSRLGDMPALTRLIVQQRARSLGLDDMAVTDEALDVLGRYRWPGNIRELENELVRALLRAGNSDRIRREHLSSHLLAESESPRTLASSRRELEKRMLQQALARSGGNRSRAARTLGLSRQGLYAKIKKLGLELEPRFYANAEQEEERPRLLATSAFG
jgi:transcriptional regulator with PAS, ATPase and Fis domain